MQTKTVCRVLLALAAVRLVRGIVGVVRGARGNARTPLPSRISCSADGGDGQAGSTVTWKNLDGEPHTVVSTGHVPLRRAGPERHVQFKFDKPGVYKVFCGIHPNYERNDHCAVSVSVAGDHSTDCGQGARALHADRLRALREAP